MTAPLRAQPALTLEDFQRAEHDTAFRQFLTSQYGVAESDLPPLVGGPDFTDVTGRASSTAAAPTDTRTRSAPGLMRALTSGLPGPLSAIGGAAALAEKLNPGSVEATARGVGNGATLGWGDEAVNAARSLVTGQPYDSLQLASDARQAQLRQEHPVADLAGNVAGGAAVLGPLSKAETVARPLWSRVLRGGAEGAALGLVQGAGTAGQGNRMAGGTVGGIGGGLIGAAAPVVVDAAAATGRRAVDLLRRAKPAEIPPGPAMSSGTGALPPRGVPATSGPAAAEVRAFPEGMTTPQRRAQDLLLNRLGNEGKTVQQVAAEAAAAGDQPMTLMEAGQAPRSLADYVAQTPTRGGRQLTQFAEARNYEAPARVRGALEQGFGIPRQEAGAELSAMIEARRAAATPAFTQAFEQAPAIADPGVLSAYQTLADEFPAAVTRAQRSARFLGVDAGTAEAPSLNYLDLFRQELGKEQSRALTDAGAPGSGAYLAGVTRVKRDFVDRLRALVPDYGKALDKYAGDAAMEGAFRDGQGALRLTGDKVRTLLASYGSEGERDAFRKAALDALHTRAGETSYGGNVKLTLDRNVNDADLLKALFPTEQAYAGFAKRLGLEGEMAQSYRMLTGNSATARRLFEGENAGQALDVAGKALRGRFGDATMTALRPLLTRAQGITPEVADALGTYFTATGPDLQQILNDLARREAQRVGTQSFSRMAGRAAVQGMTSTGRVP